MAVRWAGRLAADGFLRLVCDPGRVEGGAVSLLQEISDAALRYSGGPARWRAERTAEQVLAILHRRGLMPVEVPLPECGEIGRRRFGELPPEMREAILHHLSQHRVGWWQWSRVCFGKDEWRVCCYAQAPDGGPVWELKAEGVGPGLLWKTIPAAGCEEKP